MELILRRDYSPWPGQAFRQQLLHRMDQKTHSCASNPGVLGNAAAARARSQSVFWLLFSPHVPVAAGSQERRTQDLPL